MKTLARMGRKTWLIPAGVVVLAATGWAIGRFWLGPGPRPALVGASKPVLAYSVDAKLTGYASKIAAYAQGQGWTTREVHGDQAEIVISATRPDDGGAQPVDVVRRGTPVKAITDGTLVLPDETAAAYVWPVHPDKAIGKQTGQTVSAELAKALTTAEPAQQWTMTAIGDIIIGRSVYLKMLQYDVLHPFAKLSEAVAASDYTVADLENAFSDPRAVVADDGMTFVSPTRGAAGLKSAGIDAVNLANNHSYNGGAAGFTDTIATLDRLGVAHFGGGPDLAAAKSPFVATVKGVKVAMLGYSSIVGSVAAGADTPGMNYLDMAPWGTLNEAHVQAMEADIRAAKARADVVLVYYHWGTEYTHTANADQRSVAHRAVDAGADVIVGTHPHWVQGVEWYHDRLITYSLGNFIFDQEWSAQTKQGAYLKLTFAGKVVTGAELMPYVISDYNQPAPAAADTAAEIWRNISQHSWWIGP